MERTLSEISNREETEHYKEVERSEMYKNLQLAQITALEKEKQKVQKDEQRAYEQRIASLENRLAELSSTIAKYNRSRQEDQNEIFKLREKISELSSLTLTTKLSTLEDAQCQTTFTEISQSICSQDTNINADRFVNNPQNSKNYFDKSPTFHDNFIFPNMSKETLNISEKEPNSHILDNQLKNLQIKVQMLADQNNTLTEQYNESVSQYEKQMDELKKQQAIIISKYEKEIQELHLNHYEQISELENQVQKQRERTLALLEEKEQEVTTLKTSFQLFVPGNKYAQTIQPANASAATSQLDQLLDGSLKLNTNENPHILYYAHELARRDVLITNLRKNQTQLENTVREVKKELILLKQTKQEQVNNLKIQISQLEKFQTKEGANLEYLKNVVVNYLHTKNSGSRRHMLNAIAVILKLTDSEINKIKITL